MEAEYYDFTEVEPDLIINDDIRYRMGGQTKEDDTVSDPPIFATP